MITHHKQRLGRWRLLLATLLVLDMVFAANRVMSGPETGKPVGSRAAGGEAPNPHSDLIFRATGASSCIDCHRVGTSGALMPQPMDNDLVRSLRDKAKGVHGPGRFADCLRCHAGGSKGVEKY